jgi:hypothetical protein
LHLSLNISEVRALPPFLHSEKGKKKIEGARNQKDKGGRIGKERIQISLVKEA